MKIETGLKIELMYPERGIQSFKIGDELPNVDKQPSSDEIEVSGEGQYITNKDGVFEKNENGVFEWISPYFKVKEIHKDSRGDVYETIFEFYDSKGNLKTETISQQELEEGMEAFGKILQERIWPGCPLII